MSATPESQRRKPNKLQKRRRQPGLDGKSTMSSDAHWQEDRDASSVFEQKESDQEPDDLPDNAQDDYADNQPSFVQRRPDSPNEDDGSIDEGEMRRHMMDMESSFLPDTAAASLPQSHQVAGRLGVDDTYLELGRPGPNPPPDEAFTGLAGHVSGRPASHRLGEIGSSTPSDVSEASPPAREGEDADEGNDGHEHENDPGSPTSPTEAAAHRGHMRNMSTASVRRMTPVRAKSISIHSGDVSGNNSRPITPSAQRPLSTGSTIRPGIVPVAQDVALPESDDTTHDDEQSMRSLRFSSRPMYIKNRQASQRSSTSSVTSGTDLSGSDAAVNSDYALQTGGAVLGARFQNSTKSRKFHSRFPSAGSTASHMDRDDEGVSISGHGPNGTPTSASTKRVRLDGETEFRPETPRASTSRAEAPTDTAITQHVQSIQVPDTIARDFRALNHSLSPNKQRPASSDGGRGSFQSLPRRTLTLKEQNSKIDKLTKENFDLKLKIHFLDQALQSRSDDGVKELIDKNVQFQTDLANERKETQTLRRKMKELERKLRGQEEELANARRQEEDERHRRQDSDDEDPTLQAEMHAEILYLRQQLDYSENKVTTLSEDVMTKELEKRKMAEHMRSMAGSRGEDTAGMKETMDMWQDLLNAETGRREQAEEDLRKLREEITAMRIERATPAPTKVAKRRPSKIGYEQSADDDSEYLNGGNGVPVTAMVEQLKHENAELRRDLGAQTSMLTSRNRERERLQQEIEDLKLFQRKSDGARSVTGESIFERSISRAHQRAPSRTSEAGTAVTETERDDWEKKEGLLRDQNSEQRLKYQELERTHNTYLQYVSALEGDFQEMEQELNENVEDLRALQSERDEALQAYEEKEREYEKLQQEALAEIEKLEKERESLEGQLENMHKRHQKTQSKLEHTTDGYKGLQGELREITQSVMNLEDEKQANMRTIGTIEQQLADAEEELQNWEKKCKEIDQKNRKLEITQESLHSEITFLREEQEGDKIKIGEVENALNAAQQTIQDEQEKMRELEDAIVDERQQRDVLENKSKEEVQMVLDDLNTEIGKTKDEVRKLRRALSAKEVEAGNWKQRLEELEQSFRSALGDVNGTKQSMLAEVERLQNELAATANKLDRTKMELADKDRLLRHRDGLLESTSLESRRLSDLLDKERTSRRHELEKLERASKGQATNMRTIVQHETRVLELESANTQERRRMAALEQQYREELLERNNLLLALWNRLSTLCGTDWAQSHALVEGEVPSVDVILRRLPSFSINLISAIKTVESLIGSFKVRVRQIERDLWKDYQTLEHNLTIRIRRMDYLEQAVEDAHRAIAEEAAQRPQTSRTLSARGGKGSEEIGRLKSEVKVLKAELKFHRQHPSPMAQQMLNQQVQFGPDHARRASSAGSSGKTQNSPARQIMAQLLRHHSTSALEPLQRVSDEAPSPSQQPIVLSTAPAQPNEQRWIHRLKELERRLKAEREARLLDRKGARQRLEEGRLENEELRQMLEHEKMRQEGPVEEADEPGSEGARSERSEERESDVHVGSGVD